MAIAVNDVIQITATGTSLGEPITNVFYYQCETTGITTGVYTALLNDFITKVMTPRKAVMNTQTGYSTFEVKNVSNLLDFAVLASTQNGTLPGAVLAPHVTFSAQLVRTTLLTRNGSKRFSGLVEEGITGTTINWVLAQKTALEAGLAADITSGGVTPTECKAVIVGRIPAGMPNAGDLDLTRINDVAQARMGNRVTSQVSRKVAQTY